jgi:hypothetical protein
VTSGVSDIGYQGRLSLRNGLTVNKGEPGRTAAVKSPPVAEKSLPIRAKPPTRFALAASANKPEGYHLELHDQSRGQISAKKNYSRIYIRHCTVA